MRLLRALLALGFALYLLPALAAEGDAARAVIQKTAPLQKISGFRASQLPGYFEGVIGGQVIYASADGRYLLRGTVEDVANGVNLSDASMAAKRLEVLEKLGRPSLLSFAPPDPKYRITVFTDVDCPFCRRLHANVAEYNALGIAVDYALFPLSIHAGADRKSAAVWCAANRNNAYAAAVAGRAPERADCENPVLRSIAAGNEMGVTSTPTAIGPDGRIVAPTALMSASRLLAELQKIPASDLPNPSHSASAR